MEFIRKEKIFSLIDSIYREVQNEFDVQDLLEKDMDSLAIETYECAMRVIDKYTEKIDDTKEKNNDT